MDPVGVGIFTGLIGIVVGCSDLLHCKQHLSSSAGGRVAADEVDADKTAGVEATKRTTTAAPAARITRRGRVLFDMVIMSADIDCLTAPNIDRPALAASDLLIPHPVMCWIQQE